MSQFERAKAKYYQRHNSVPVEVRTPQEAVPVLLTPKKKIDGDIEIRVSVGDMDEVFAFRCPNLLGNLIGRMNTPEGMRELLRNMLREKFGRVEDAVR